MKKLKNNQNGFGAMELVLVLVIIVILGGVGWYVLKARNNTNNSYNNASTSTNVTKPVSNTISIKEWGVKLSVGTVSDATYKLVGNNKAFLMTNSMSTDSKCTNYYTSDWPSFAFIVRAKPTDLPVFGDDPGTNPPKTAQEYAAKYPSYVKKLNSYYYYTVHGNGMSCGNYDENKLDGFVESYLQVQATK